MLDFNLLNSSFSLNDEQLEFYAKNRYIKLRSVLSPSLIDHFNGIISDRVKKLSNDLPPLDQRDSYGKAFIQIMNLWVNDPLITQLIHAPRLAQIATDLMGTKGVRLYHDQALFKEGGGGITPWHADQYYWPLKSDKTITAWIPLQKTPLEMGPLEFSAGSHLIRKGRELEIGAESENQIHKNLKITDCPHVIEPFDIGEVSFHSGWIFHRAGANQTNQVRKAITIIYMDRDMILKSPENKNQINDWKTWCPGAQIGEVIDTPLNPVLYEHINI